MRTRFLLIRHGANHTLGVSLAGRAEGVHLNERGREQASELAEALHHAPVDAIYSSPLERCLETSQPLAQALHLPVEVEPAIMETHFGAWTGSTFEALDADPVWKSWNSNRSGTRPPGGETMQEVQDRFLKQLDVWAGTNAGRMIAVFSHSDPIKSVVLHCRGASLDSMLAFEIDPVSSTLLEGEGGRYEVLFVNASPEQAGRQLEALNRA